MLKQRNLLRKLASTVGSCAEKAARQVLSLNETVDGREEETTSQLKSEISLHLLDEVSRELGGIQIQDLRVDVYLFKKKQEKDVGADILGVMQMKLGQQKVAKGYLAQAKVGTAKVRNGSDVATCYDQNLPMQVERMLRRSSSSYVFIYTDAGVFVVPASEVHLENTASVSTQEHSYRGFGGFYEEFFACFVGDSGLAPDDLSSASLAELAERLRVQNALGIAVTAIP